MTTTTDYRASSHTMMAQSRDELAKGDLQQASEKGWGAAAQMMKAIAESRGLGTRPTPTLAPDRQPPTRRGRRPGHLPTVQHRQHAPRKLL